MPMQVPNGRACTCGAKSGAPYGGYAGRIVTKEDGEPVGAQVNNKGNCCPISQAAKSICWLDETLRSAAVAAGADTVFSLQVKWWWQIQEWVNLGDQTNETFSLTEVRYGQSIYSLTEGALNGSTVDGAAYGDANGVDVRKWNIDSDHPGYYPIPAMALDDPVLLTFNNGNAAAQDLALSAGGPAVLQIG